jgi:hypothetical protein
MTATVYHWWPDCPAWPVDADAADDPVHLIGYSPDQVTCPECLRDPTVRGASRDD